MEKARARYWNAALTQNNSLMFAHSGPAPLETGVCLSACICSYWCVCAASEGIYTIRTVSSTSPVFVCVFPTCSVDEDAGRASLLLFNVL